MDGRNTRISRLKATAPRHKLSDSILQCAKARETEQFPSPIPHAIFIAVVHIFVQNKVVVSVVRTRVCCGVSYTKPALLLRDVTCSHCWYASISFYAQGTSAGESRWWLAPVLACEYARHTREEMVLPVVACIYMIHVLIVISKNFKFSLTHPDSSTSYQYVTVGICKDAPPTINVESHPSMDRS
jgi:hypothetical protein